MYPSLPKLVMAAVNMYKDDTLMPSIVTSWVRDQWYVSLVRWRGPRKEMTRQVVFGISHDDLEAAYAEGLQRLEGIV